MRSNEEVKVLIEKMLLLQKDRAFLPCPRCGRYRMDTNSPARNALSRYADVYICDDCGTEEAMMDYLGMEPVPFNQWAIAITEPYSEEIFDNRELGGNTKC